MYKIAAMGDKDSIYGFASIGLEIFPIDEPIKAIHKIRDMVEGGYAVIFITEQLATAIESELDRYRSLPQPAIIPIPGIHGNTGLGMRNVSKSVEQAVGSDILSDA
ncbi:MAG: V-type ATP synthase subunit F [Ruminococcaceae bacterium]|nr:V-type ATP synthase subunit F [Oscillospiraceae bacterium]